MTTTRGFTLVEVLVALVIVAIGMGAVLAAITSAADTTAYLREKSFAEWVAMNRIAELRLQARSPTVGKSSGEAEFAGRRWRWEQEVLKLEIPGTQRIDVRVRPDDSGTRNAGWVGNISGIIGDAVAPPDGKVLPWWELSPPPGQNPGAVPGSPVGPPTPDPGVEPDPDPDPEPETSGRESR